MHPPGKEPSAVPEPPFTTADLPGTAGAIGPDPEDFRVDECPAYLAGGTGEHRYVRIEKRLLTTPEAVQHVARAAGVEPRDIGYAGLKDKHAVTTQWLSVPAASAPPESWALPDSIRVLEVSLHNNKLRTGHLRGNRFSIALVDTHAEALSRAVTLVERLERLGLRNYFGAQRFGRGGENLGRALEWLESGGKRRLTAFLLKLYPSVVQAAVYDAYLTLRAETGLNRLLLGDVVRLEGSGATFTVEDPEREAPRLSAGDIHLTGPMIGPKMRPAQGLPLELEQEARQSLALSDAAERVLARFAPGTRRDLVVRPTGLSVRQDGADRLRVDFELPAGSYATVLIREFTRSARLASGQRLD